MDGPIPMRYDPPMDITHERSIPAATALFRPIRIVGMMLVVGLTPLSALAQPPQAVQFRGERRINTIVRMILAEHHTAGVTGRLSTID